MDRERVAVDPKPNIASGIFLQLVQPDEFLQLIRRMRHLLFDMRRIIEQPGPHPAVGHTDLADLAGSVAQKSDMDRFTILRLFADKGKAGIRHQVDFRIVPQQVCHKYTVAGCETGHHLLIVRRLKIALQIMPFLSLAEG